MSASSGRVSQAPPNGPGDDEGTSASRSGRPRSERSRNAILQATLEQLERHGVNGITIEGIAAEAGVGKATIYRWWPSRTALVIDSLEQLPELEAPDHGDFASDLRALVENFCTLLTTTPLAGVLAHLGGEASHNHPEVRAFMDRRTTGGLTMVERAVVRGDLPEGIDASAVLSLALGPVINRVFYGPRPDDEFIDLILATLAAGLPAATAAHS